MRMEIKDGKLQYGSNREAGKTSALSSDKFIILISSDGNILLPSDEIRIIKQVKFIYSPLGKAFEK